uniref:Uncharacterized protein n=1 Tax=Trypanosoma congolense (strain IL3000) TaxID=1068625 RepID=G0UMA1_TRYCI|nr:hypothetical protein, unlikely [Trypanosoma congolense IL3000]
MFWWCRFGREIQLPTSLPFHGVGELGMRNPRAPGVLGRHPRHVVNWFSSRPCGHLFRHVLRPHGLCDITVFETLLPMENKGRGKGSSGLNPGTTLLSSQLSDSSFPSAP